MTQRVAIFDLDRTITKIGTFTPFLLSTRANTFSKLTLAPNFTGPLVSYVQGRLDRVSLKNKMMEIALSEFTADEIAKHSHSFVDQTLLTGIRPKAIEALKHHQKNGDYTVLATASVDFYADLFAEKLGFDKSISTVTNFEQISSGPPIILGGNCYGENKLDMVTKEMSGALEQSRQEQHWTFYSDHHSDIALFKKVEAPFVISPNPKTKKKTDALEYPVLNW
ncbi:HAD-IB family phosphatase [Hyphococcus lacteus]|uniref:HAD-IB family phosphatase n=1 Tax=Hyphococcus lacteus TaxID=3143536 RepID=A0ABV3Z483_9PROT